MKTTQFMKHLLMGSVINCLLVSCNKQTDNKLAVQVQALNLSDTFRLEIPPFQKPLDFVYYLEFKKEESQLNLRSLEKGFDSLEMRIWYGWPLCGERLIRVLLNKGRWSAKVYSISAHINAKNEGLTVFDFLQRQYYRYEVENKKPRSGFHSFIRNLFESGILTLPDIRNIKGFRETFSGSDGGGVQIEIASRNVYRTYVYFSPEYYATKYPEADSVMNVLTLLEREFSLPGLCQDRIRKNKVALSQENIYKEYNNAGCKKTVTAGGNGF